MENYPKERKDRTGLFLAIVLILGVCAFLFNNYHLRTKEKTYSVQAYNNLELRMKYLYMENQVKSQILYDLIVDSKLDSSFILSIEHHVPPFILNPRKSEPIPFVNKQVIGYQLDSICADWYESIAFMFMDAKHDSAWVLGSEGYAKIMINVNNLRENSELQKAFYEKYVNADSVDVLERHAKEVSKLETKLLMDEALRKIAVAKAKRQQ